MLAARAGLLVLFALVALSCAYFAILRLAAAVRSRPIGLNAALGLAGLVVYEAALLHGLSRFRAVTLPWLIAGNVLPMFPAAFVRPAGSLRRIGWRMRHADRITIVLAVLTLIAAAAYAPNNWDSMTYHMARVAHWMANRSVDPYPTNIARQVYLPPGAEYLILALQVMSQTDFLANLVQWGSWLVLVGTAGPLARTFGSGSSGARWASVLVATLPMGLLQASSTQNDLVAAALAAALVIATLPFLHRRRAWTPADVGILGIAIAAGYLVKPTSLIAGAPFLAMACIRRFRDLPSLYGGIRWWQIGPTGLLIAGAIIPFELGRSANPKAGRMLDAFVYRAGLELPDRAQNLARGLLRNLPLPFSIFNRLSPTQTLGCPSPHDLCLVTNLSFGEDVAADSLAMLAILGALWIWVVARNPVGRLAKLGLTGTASAWVLFHLLFRDNIWITRLQLPLFALTPLVLGAYRSSRLARHPYFAEATMVAASCLGVMAVTLSVRRPLDPARLFHGRGRDAYYAGLPDVQAQNAQALKLLEASSCRRLGLFIGADSYDYPLTWRAMKAGFEVRHVLEASSWPCAVFSDRGMPPSDAETSDWVQSDLPSLFFRVVHVGGISNE